MSTTTLDSTFTSSRRRPDREPPLSEGWLPALLDSRGVRVLQPWGTVDRDGYELIERSVEPRLRHGGPRVVLDLSRVGHLDYRGLGAFARIAARLRREGGDLRLSGASGYLQAILRAVGLDGQILSFSTVEAAVASFPGPLPAADAIEDG